MPMGTFTEAELLRLRDQHEAWLRSQPGVVGTGIGLADAGDVALKVYSDRMPPETRSAILTRLARCSRRDRRSRPPSTTERAVARVIWPHNARPSQSAGKIEVGWHHPRSGSCDGEAWIAGRNTVRSRTGPVRTHPP